MTDTATFLNRCGLFRGFDTQRLQTLSQAAEEVLFDIAETILREGDAGDAMYVILEGAVQVYTQDQDGREVVLARLEAGDHFGEQALLPGGTGRRNASVRAAAASLLARLPKSAFQSALSDDDALRERLVDIGAGQIRNNLQQLSPLARGIGLNTTHGLRRELSPGDVLFRQGDEADALYFVSEGRLAIYRNDTMIGYVERGGCVGELALVRRDLRSATVVAEEPAEVIAVPRAAFDDAYSHSEAVRDHIATLQRAYEFPQRGIVTQHAGTFAGHECITTLYHLLDGRVFAAYRVIGQTLYAIEWLGTPAKETLTWQNSEQSRELRIDDHGVVTGLTVHGEWPDVHAFHLFVLDGGRIGKTERQAFTETGSFDMKAAAVTTDVVCHCVNVTSERLRSVISAGAATFTDLQKATGCGTVCGGCIPAVTEMLGVEEWILADVVTEIDEAPGIRTFEMVPRLGGSDTPYPEALPGQHVVIEGMVAGMRLRRPYTLSSAGSHGGRPTITVKREEHGAFSPWLFDDRKKDEPLRITRPKGGYVIDLSGKPIVCMVAGIGVTPAISAVRTVMAATHPMKLCIHYSGRTRDQMAFVQELEAAKNSHIEVVVRETSLDGRINLAEVSAITRRFTDADWYLCGPQAYLDNVGRLLRTSRIADSRIHVETFTAVGAPALSLEEREASRQFLLVPPRRRREPAHVSILTAIGKSLMAVANSPLTNWKLGPLQMNPLRWIEDRIGKAARLDPALPMEYIGIVSALSWGPFQYQVQGFDRLMAMRDANRSRARKARDRDKPLPAETPDGSTFTYWAPAAPFPRFPKVCAVDTGWTKAGTGRLLPVYVTRSRTALAELLRNPEPTDRGPIPYHFFQQVVGRRDIPNCPGRKPAGLFGGQIQDNATWTEDREISADMFSFAVIDSFTASMAAAADEVSLTIDEALTQHPKLIVDLNILLSKIAYTIIIRGVFGNVDLAEMHALGRTLSEALRDSLDFVFQYSMGRQSVPPRYVEMMQTLRETIRKMIDLLRELDRQDKLTEVQRKAPVVRMVLETANQPDGAYEQLFTLVLPLVIAGHETTGHIMSWAFYEMARNQKLENDVLDEVERFRSAHVGRALTTADYDERPLSFALLAESLRRHPPVQALPRTPATDGAVPPDSKTGIGAFRYPAGAMIVFSIIGIHLDPERWPDPYEFRTDRWLEGVHEGMNLREKGGTVRANIRAREHAMDWLPFADGPGRCAGQHFNAHEFLLILDALLPRYHFELVDAEAVPHSRTMIVGPEAGRMGVRIRPRGLTAKAS